MNEDAGRTKEEFRKNLRTYHESIVNAFDETETEQIAKLFYLADCLTCEQNHAIFAEPHCEEKMRNFLDMFGEEIIKFNEMKDGFLKFLVLKVI